MPLGRMRMMAGGNFVLAGFVVPYGSSTAPSGWLLCNGDAVSRSTYDALFTIIGTTFGVGDGSTTFNVPDLRGRAPIGSGTGAGLTARTLAANVGAETVTVSTSELASHTHTQDSHNHTQDAHTHTVNSTHSHSIGGGTQAWSSAGAPQPGSDGGTA